MDTIEFDIEIFDLKNEWNYQDCYYKVQLHDDRLAMHCKYVCTTWVDDDDHTLGTKERVTDSKTIIKRKNFVSLEKLWSSISECWIIEIEVDGYSDNVKFYFKDTNWAYSDRIFTIFEKWIFDN